MIDVIHKELDRLGIPIVGLSEAPRKAGGKIRIDFDRSATKEQREQARAFVDNFQTNYRKKTEQEVLQEIRANKDVLIEQLLKERFYGDSLD